jgi:2,6-dihydroxypyridine 3-monooxygenase
MRWDQRMIEPLRVAIVGGSLGGLTAALVLRDAGCRVELLERSSAALDSRGAGIVLHPMTVRYFLEKGILEPGRISTAASRLRYLAADGRVIDESPCGYLFTAWNTLYGALLGCLGRDSYHLGQTMVGFEPDGDQVRVSLADGHELACDLLVCADGISSVARARLLPRIRQHYAGYVGWRGTVPEADLSRAALGELAEVINYHLMAGSHVLTYPIPSQDGNLDVGHRLTNFVWYRNVPEGRALEELMTDRWGARREISVPPGAVREEFREELREAAKALPPAIAEAVRKTAEPFIQPIVDVDVPKLAFGRVCLIGDAAFVARPHAAAGTAKAAADAWSLREELLASDWNLEVALPAWERRQLELGKDLLARVRAMGDSSQFGAGWRAGDPSLRFGLFAAGDSEPEGGYQAVRWA